MNSPSSPERGAGSSAPTGSSDGERSGLSKSTRTVERSSDSDSSTECSTSSPCGTTCERFLPISSGVVSMSSAEDSPVRDGQQPGNGWARTILEIYGPRQRGLWHEFVPVSSSSRTCPRSPEATISTTPFSESLKRAGLRWRGRSYELPILGHRIEGLDSGSQEYELPTPNKYQRKGDWIGLTLTGAVAQWPTPTTRDHKDTGDCISAGTVPVNGLLGRAVEPSKTSGSLDPEFVEYLMGFPIGWTASARLVMHRSACARQWRGICWCFDCWKRSNEETLDRLLASLA